MPVATSVFDTSDLPQQEIDRFVKMITDSSGDPDEARRVITMAMLRGVDIARGGSSQTAADFEATKGGYESPVSRAARNGGAPAMDHAPQSAGARQRAELEMKLGFRTKRVRHV